MRLLLTAYFAISMLMFGIDRANADQANYNYDDAGRLTSITYAVGTGTTTITYTYDGAGNRTGQSVSCTGSSC